MDLCLTVFVCDDLGLVVFSGFLLTSVGLLVWFGFG